MRVLITGGAGFVGSRLGLLFRRDGAEVVAFDNLRRRGSETNIPLLAAAGITFEHGDVRERRDLDDISGAFDLVVDASAEPSVHAGGDGSPDYVLDTNLGGTLNVLEFTRQRSAALIFLSTSRVYSIAPLREVAYTEGATRLDISLEQPHPGCGPVGISEAFPTDQPRSFYGTSKLASEMVIQEYVDSYGLRAIINRCGVLSGAGQFGKSEQGVVALWAANHLLEKPLRYIGFGGQGKQVRDVLHPEDLFRLLTIQLEAIETCSGEAFNVGGGPEMSTSLCELTAVCEATTGNSVPMGNEPATAAVDVPIYISDNTKVSERFDWRPERTVESIVVEIAEWIRGDWDRLKPIFT